MASIKERLTLAAYALRSIFVVNPTGQVGDPVYPIHAVGDDQGNVVGISGAPFVTADGGLGTDGTAAPTLPGGATGVRGWLRYVASLLSGTLQVADGANAAYTNFAALTADDTTAHNVAAGRLVEVNCTVAGNISLKLANGNSKILPVQVGFQTFPWAAVGLNLAGTTATVSAVNWY